MPSYVDEFTTIMQVFTNVLTTFVFGGLVLRTNHTSEYNRNTSTRCKSQRVLEMIGWRFKGDGDSSGAWEPWSLKELEPWPRDPRSVEPSCPWWFSSSQGKPSTVGQSRDMTLRKRAFVEGIGFILEGEIRCFPCWSRPLQDHQSLSWPVHISR